MASTLSLSKQCDADTADDFGVLHSWAWLPVPITGKAVIRNRAAPIGMSVTFSTGSSDFTGLGCSLPTSLCPSCFQAAIFLTLARNSDGAFSGWNGWLANG